MKVFNLILLGLVSGCAAVRTVHEMSPVANVYTKRDFNSQVEVYDQSNPANLPLICFANIGAHGNGYAKYLDLVNAIKEETGKLGGAKALITGAEQNANSSVTTHLGYGIYTTNKIITPSLYGRACNVAKVSLGIVYEFKDGKITYVKKDSIAEKYGLREGDQIIAVNKKVLSLNIYAMETEILAKDVGNKVEIEYLNREGDKQLIIVTLE